MNGVFYIGATGLDTQQQALNVVANNIANLNTTAFKRSQAQFAQLISASKSASKDLPGPSASAQPNLLGVQLSGTPIDFTQGQLTQTGGAMDIAISGAGFLELMGPGGQAQLWRGGAMTVNSDGYLSGANGMPLKAMISVPSGASSLTIGADGKVQAVLSGATTPTTIGQIEIAQVKDLTTLTAGGGGVYLPTSESDITNVAPGAEGAGVLVSGSVETSNVNLANEMVTLLLMQRSYSANAQVVQAGDQLMSIANDLKR